MIDSELRNQLLRTPAFEEILKENSKGKDFLFVPKKFYKKAADDITKQVTAEISKNPSLMSVTTNGIDGATLYKIFTETGDEILDERRRKK